MDWLLLLLRLLLGLPNNSEPQPLAVRPDGTTVPVPPGNANSVGSDRSLKDWLTLFMQVVSRYFGGPDLDQRLRSASHPHTTFARDPELVRSRQARQGKPRS